MSLLTVEDPAVTADCYLVVPQVDLAALDIVVREAGGRLTSLDGVAGPHGGSAVATNGLLHDEVLTRLNAG